MTYQQTVDWLFKQFANYQNQGGSAYKPGLENIITILSETGNPEKDLRFFHVAGTNGKGSVCNMLASIMQANNYKTGLFTSPHLIDFRERIRINGEMISEDFVVDYVSKNKNLLVKINASFFEITTAMALTAFKENRCDVCILETGLGGRLDATNVITPDISIITNIGLDHTQFLGNTLSEIAFEKAGIIKENIPVVVGKKQAETWPVFEKVAQTKNAKLFLSELIETIQTDLSGSFQKENVATVTTAIDVLKNLGWNFTEEKIKFGFEHVKASTGFQGRFQTINQKPLIIIDAAHNADGVQLILNELNKINKGQLHVIYGAANDKDLKSIFSLFPNNARYYFTEFKSNRSSKINDLKLLAEINNLQANYFTNSSTALDEAKLKARENDVIAILGSFFLIQEFL